MMKKLVLFAALLVAACQPQRQEMLDPNTPPALQDGAVVMEDGARLPLKSWVPTGKPKAVLLALHGFNDYSHAYALPGEYLSEHGVAVYAYDQRGFGGSEEAGIWGGMDNLTRDMKTMMALLKAHYPGIPLYVLGESMGGAVVINGCAELGCEEADGLLLVAPALWGRDTLSNIYYFSVSVLAHITPDSHWTGEDLEIQASDNLEILYAMGADPLIIKETRTDAIYGLVRLMDQAQTHISELKQPILFLYGAKDEIVPADPVASAIDNINASHSVGYYGEGYHMLLRDLQRQVVYDDILSWINNRYHPLPSGADMGWQEELLMVE